MWGATAPKRLRYFLAGISIHAPRVGSDVLFPSPLLVFSISIHAPRVGSDYQRAKQRPRREDFNPRSPCGERLRPKKRLRKRIFISIHAPRVGSDTAVSGCAGIPNPISIHAPRVGSDLRIGRIMPKMFLFQSTLPVWGATHPAVDCRPHFRISVHAPRVGSDWKSVFAEELKP